MRILALGDPHGKLLKNLDFIVKRNNIEIIVCVGDIPLTPINPRDSKSWEGFIKKANKSFRDSIDKLCSFDLPVLVLRGNVYRNERGDKITKSIFKKYKNLVYKKTGKIKLKDTTFIFFDYSYEFHMSCNLSLFREKEMKSNKFREKTLNKLLKESKKPILISHNPPYGYVDKAYNGEHVGSKILLEVIKKHQPKLVLCGHIHEAKGKAKIGKTRVINLGCCGDYEIIEV